MRKLFLFVVLALLLTFGVANATNIPQMVDPKEYPTVWTEVVYNGSGSTIYSGHIVQWDFETSDSSINYNDDMCMWIATADAASDIWTAGVVPVGNNIANGAVGAIIIRGPAYIMEHTTPPTANEICGTHTDGTVTTDGAGANTSSIGITVDASPTYGPNGGSGSGFSIVYVEPTQSDD